MTSDLAIPDESAPATAASSPMVEELREIWKIAAAVAPTEFVPQALRGKPEKVFAAMLTGRELGVGMMTSLRHIYIVDGKPDLSAALQMALIRRRGHRISGTATATEAEVSGERADTGDTMTVRWDLAKALQAGLIDKIEEGKAVARSERGNAKPWERHTQMMLWHRCVTQLADMLFADCLVGTVGLGPAEELGDGEQDSR